MPWFRCLTKLDVLQDLFMMQAYQGAKVIQMLWGFCCFNYSDLKGDITVCIIMEKDEPSEGSHISINAYFSLHSWFPVLEGSEPPSWPYFACLPFSWGDWLYDREEYWGGMAFICCQTRKITMTLRPQFLQGSIQKNVS